MKNQTLIKFFLLIFIISIFTLILHPQTIKAVPSTNVKDVLSSSQYSYYGGVGVGTSAGDSIVKLDTGLFPSKSSSNLFVGDTITIGPGGSQSLYTVKDISSPSTIVLNTGISAASAVPGGSIIATRSAVHTVSFNPQMNSAGGKWQVLIKATSGVAAEKSSDGIPDQLGFDLGTLDATGVTCPWGATASIGGTTAVTLGSPSVTSYYHVITCSLGAGVTNPVGTGVTGTIIIGNTTKYLINPSPSGAEGSASVFNFILRQLDSTSTLLDQTVGQIAVVESVRVTATVDPSISFYIDAVGNTLVSSAACGAGTTLSSGAPNTTGDQVIFGSLALGGFNQLAQRLSCTTNGAGGYSVTVYKDGVMKNINTATTIPDTLCNGTNCSITAATAWGTPSTTRSEFGYTVTLGSGATLPFTAPNFKPFGNGNVQAQTIMYKNATPSTIDTANVCYRLSITNTQEAGDYEAKIVYTATATF